MARLKGCLLIVVVLLIVYMLGKFGGKSNGDGLPTLALLALPTSRPDVRPSPTDPPGVTIIPTEVVNRSGFVTVTAGAGTVYPTATVTDTPQPAATNTDLPTAAPSTATADVQAINSETYYATRKAIVRKCASTECASLGQIDAGTSVTVTGSTAGQEVTAGNVLWYQIQYGGQVAYIYSPSLTKNAPVKIVPTAIPQQQIVAPPAQQNVSVPRTCATAKAMGFDQYQAALINPTLDADGDHKACYSDK